MKTAAAAIGAYMFLNKEGVLNPKIVLVSIAYFNSLRNDLTMFPYAVSLMAKAFVSLKRIREFLEADEVSSETLESQISLDILEGLSLRQYADGVLFFPDRLIPA